MALTSADFEAAIKSVLTGGQEYRLVDGTQVSRANLNALMERRTQLQQEEAQASTGQGMFVPLQQGRPS